MSKIALAKINSFASKAEQIDVPTKEPIFVLSSSQLQDIITRAIQPLKDEIEGLKATVANQGEKMATLEATQDLHAENQFIQLQLIDKLRQHKGEPGKTEIFRAEKIERYLKERPDHKATFETLKGHLRIDNDLLSKSIKHLMKTSSGRYGIVRTPGGDKRKRSLIMLPR